MRDSERGPATSTAPTAIDLFCGAGGFSIGLERAGFDVRLGVDVWRTAVETYRHNFKHPVICADVGARAGRELLKQARSRKGQIDLVVGGPPCQGFSIQRIGPDQDRRNNLVLQYARLLEEIAPRLFVMENVPGLLGKRGRHLFEEFLSHVEGAGFETSACVINAADYGVPQIRKRVVVLGWKPRSANAFELPKATRRVGNYTTVQQAIGDLPVPPGPEVLDPTDPLHRQTRLSELNRRRLRHIPPGGGMEDLPVELRVDCHKAGADRIGHRYVYGRLAPDRPANTITARFDSFTRGRFAHPVQDRNITLREGARLQTFPDTFRFSGNQEDIAAQIGNAVPPLLAEAIARSALRALRNGAASADGEPTHSARQYALFSRRMLG